MAQKLNKAQLDRPHYGCLYHSLGGTSGGTVFGAAETAHSFDTADTTNGFGVTQTTGSGAYFTINRAGVYKVNYQAFCIDVASTTFICWYEVSTDNGSSWRRARQAARSIPIGEAVEYSWQTYLPVGARVRMSVYSGSGATRFGAPSGADDLGRRMANYLAITEVR